MVASDSFPFIILLLVLALALALVIGGWVRRRRPLSPLVETTAPVARPAPVPEISEQQLLWNTLSQREEQIARLAAEDWSDDEIARQLSLSVRTVQNHLQHAREKLNIHSRHEFKYFLQHLGPEMTAAPK